MREPAGEILREHQVDAVVNRHDRTAPRGDGQHVMRLVHELHAFAREQPAARESARRWNTAARFRTTARKFWPKLRDHRHIRRPDRDDVLGLLIDSREALAGCCGCRCRCRSRGASARRSRYALRGLIMDYTESRWSADCGITPIYHQGRSVPRTSLLAAHRPARAGPYAAVPAARDALQVRAITWSIQERAPGPFAGIEASGAEVQEQPPSELRRLQVIDQDRVVNAA